MSGPVRWDGIVLNLYYGRGERVTDWAPMMKSSRGANLWNRDKGSALAAFRSTSYFLGYCLLCPLFANKRLNRASSGICCKVMRSSFSCHCWRRSYFHTSIRDLRHCTNSGRKLSSYPGTAKPYTMDMVFLVRRSTIFFFLLNLLCPFVRTSFLWPWLTSRARSLYAVSRD